MDEWKQEYKPSDAIVPLKSAIPDWSSYNSTFEGHDHTAMVKGKNGDAQTIISEITSILLNLSGKLSVPEINTKAVTGITSITAVSGGEISDDGGAQVTERGVCWDTSENPNKSDQCTSNGDGTGSFDSDITDLDPDTRYYVRAYATNSEGTAYGGQKDFRTKQEIDEPTVTTRSIASITTNTAESGGEVTDDGGAEVTERGVCWETSENPTTNDECTSDGNGIGSFTSNLTDLSSDTQYYVRAYAINSEGTAYGNQRNFTTDQEVGLPSVSTSSISSITENSAESGGNVTDDGGDSVTGRGVCWSTSQNPTTDDECTSDGTGTGSYTSNLDNLSPDTQYYVRAYATNDEGTAYGNQRDFRTDEEPGITLSFDPTDLLIEPGSSESTTADISRDRFDGDVTLTVMTDLPSGVSSSIDQPGSGDSGTVTFSLANDHAVFDNFEVRIRASGDGIESDEEEVYLNIERTGEIGLSLDPTELLIEPGSSESTAATISRDGFDGEVTLTVMTELPSGVSSDTDQPGTGNSGSITFSLDENHTVFDNFEVRIRASGDGVDSDDANVYLDIMEQLEKPSVTTASISSITENSAESGGDVTDDGGAEVTERGVCWDTSENPKTSDDCTSDGDGTGSFTSNLTNLSSDTQYYVRAYATNSEGTAYGNQLNFRTGDVQTYSIFGVVAEDDGTTIEGLDMLLIRQDQDGNLSTSTDNSGYYIFENLRAGDDYTVAPQSTDEFEPTNKRFDNLSSNQSQDFVRIPETYTISGTVFDSEGQGIDGLDMLLIRHDQGSNLSTTTDSSGDYIFENLKSGDDYTVAPQSTDDFDPTNQRFNNLQSDQTQDFDKVEEDNSEWPRDTETEVVDVTNPETGRTWMDRNLGASKVADNYYDSEAYGDLYQWGRAADGHQKRNASTTENLSNSDQPGHGDWIVSYDSPQDWRTPQNDNFWQGLNGINNPCPHGYRLPTEAELNAERQSWAGNTYFGAAGSPLKLPVTNERYPSGSIRNNNMGFYWSSTLDGTSARILYFDSYNAYMDTQIRASGAAVRCIKD